MKNILDILFPRCCPVCGELIEEKQHICDICQGKLSYVTEPSCMKCGKQLITEEQEYCFDCTKRKHSYNRGFAVFNYDDAMKKLIGDFKFRNKREYAGFLVDEAVKRHCGHIRAAAPDAIVPVPIHPTKRWYRGYNQAELLADGIGRQLSIPVLKDLLVRDRKTLPQKTLNDIERLQNLQKAFSFSNECCERYLRNGNILKSILLVDDIYTTGSTMEACTSILKAHGIEKVYFINMCIGQGVQE